MLNNTKVRKATSKTIKGLLVSGVFLSGLTLSTSLQNHQDNQDSSLFELLTASASTSKAKPYNTVVKNAGSYKGVPIYASNLMEQTLAVGMLKGQTTISFSNVTRADPTNVARALVYITKQNPLILDVKEYAIYKNAQTGYVTKVAITYYSTKSSIQVKQNKIMKVAKNIYNKKIKNQKTKQTKVNAAYNYFMANEVYDTRAYNHDVNKTLTEGSYNSYTVYNVFVNHKGVCQGYAGALTLLLRMANIDAVNVTGNVKGGSHMWTRVYLSKSNVYDYDVTPARTGALIPYSRYRLSASQIRGYQYIQDNMWASTKMLNKYILSTKNKDHFTTNKLYFTTTNGLKAYLTSQYNKGIAVNTIKFKNGNTQAIMKTALSAKTGTPLRKKNKVSLIYIDDVYRITIQ